jgi:hypothetical protein
MLKNHLVKLDGQKELKKSGEAQIVVHCIISGLLTYLAYYGLGIHSCLLNCLWQLLEFEQSIRFLSILVSCYRVAASVQNLQENKEVGVVPRNTD